MRPSGLVMMVALLAIGSAVFMVANHVQQSEKKIRRLNAKIEFEQEGLRVLNAEWTYLNNPNRLAKVAAKHFGLQPVNGGQYITVAAIPMRAELDAAAAQVADDAAMLAQIEPGTPQNEQPNDAAQATASNVNHIKSAPMQGVLPPAARLDFPDMAPTPIHDVQVMR
jgi:cell division protein FtsL